LPVLVAFIHLAPGIPPGPLSLARPLLTSLALSWAGCALLRCFGSPARSTTALALGAAMFAMFPSISALAGGLGLASDTQWLSAASLLLCLVVMGLAWRASDETLRARLAMLQRLAVVVTTIALAVLTYYYYPRAALASTPPDFAAPLHAIDVSRAQHKPDVYHLVLDGFGRPDVLRAQYGVDLKDFVTALQHRGFEISNDAAVANYAQTYVALASMLNADYVNWLQPGLRESPSRRPAHDLIQRSAVLETFKRAGYEISFVGSTYRAAESHRLADRCACSATAFGEFESVIAASTPIGAFGLAGLDYAYHRQRVRSAFSTFENLPPPERPRLAFAHVLTPHPPFVFDDSGGDLAAAGAMSFNDGSMFPGTEDAYRNGYAAQTRFVAARVLGVVDRIEELARAAGRDAVIILHGDHGPRMRFDAVDVSKTVALDALTILLAIRWAPARADHPAVNSPVNIYRSFFRRYFAADLPLLPDRSFLSPFARPYDFSEIPSATLHGIATVTPENDAS
jgi:hypothetical protein